MLHGHTALAVMAELPALPINDKGPLATDFYHLHPAGLPWPLAQPAFQGDGPQGWRGPTGLGSCSELPPRQQHERQRPQQSVVDARVPAAAHGMRRRGPSSRLTRSPWAGEGGLPRFNKPARRRCRSSKPVFWCPSAHPSWIRRGKPPEPPLDGSAWTGSSAYGSARQSRWIWMHRTVLRPWHALNCSGTACWPIP